MNSAEGVRLILAFAAGGSIFFTLGRVFERWEFIRKGYRLPARRTSSASERRQEDE